MKHLSFFPRLAAAFLLLAAAAAPAQAVELHEFAWRARLELPEQPSLAQISVPAEALAQLQTSDARDLRVFNAAGDPVPFAFKPPPPAPAAAAGSTRPYPALPLVTPPSGTAGPQGAAQVRIEEDGKARSVWVQLGEAAPASNAAPKAALFDTTGETQPLKALAVQATLPPNTPVQVRVSTSDDLAQWTRVPVRGRLYRFEGDGAPANSTLEFEQPVQLKGRYLRLDWDVEAPMAVSAITGIVAPPAQPPTRLRAELPPPKPADKGAVEINTGFMTPLAGLVLSTAKPNTLLPVRVFGRNDAAQPWRLLANTVIYRLGSGKAEGSNPPVALNGTSAHWLRIESTSGADLSQERIQAEAEFAPVQLVFVATGAGPFELAAGRPGTPPAAVPLETIVSAIGEKKLDDLPQARVGAGVQQEPARRSMFSWRGTAPGQPTVLWVILLAGVLILAAVAWSLLRQLKADRAKG